jgi:hypothetical protein
MRRWPSPFGKKQSDSADVGSDSADPRCMPVQIGPGGPVAWPTYNPADDDVRRGAKGEHPRTDDEVMTAVHGRPPHKRTAIPNPGDQVHYVRHEWGDPEPATVLQVQSVYERSGPGGLRPRGPDEPVDPNLHINRGGDPMPLLLLMTADGLYTWTREARVRGSAGWMP